MRRREFLSAAGRGALGAGVGLLVLPKWSAGAAPSDQVVLGCIGVRGIGNSHVRGFAGQKDCRVDAVADVDTKVLGDRLKQLHGKYKNTSAKGYTDYRKMLDRKDIHAITYGTPDHWHGLNAVHAFQAGKDVYGEKPMTWCYAEAKAMLDLCRKNKRIFQLGCQRHTMSNMRRCAEILKSGALGAIHTVRCWKGVRVPNHTTPDSDPPPGVDYDMWLGPAPKRQFNKHRFHYDFRFYWDYSGGDYVNWWAHVVDLVEWGVGFTPPTTVNGRGESIDKGNAEAMKWIDVDVEFEKFKFFWTTRAPKHPAVTNGGCGMLFEGEKATMGADFGKRKIQVDGKIVKDLPDVKSTIAPHPGWHREFITGIKTRKPCSANIEYSFNLSVPMFFGRISMLLKRPLKWDPAKQEFTGDPEATKMLTRDFRKPYVLPTL